MKKTSAGSFTRAEEGVLPIALPLDSGEVIIGWYGNPPPTEELVIFTSRALHVVPDERIALADMLGYELPPKTATRGVRISTRTGIRFIPIAEAYCLVMVLQALIDQPAVTIERMTITNIRDSWNELAWGFATEWSDWAAVQVAAFYRRLLPYWPPNRERVQPDDPRLLERVLGDLSEADRKTVEDMARSVKKPELEGSNGRRGCCCPPSSGGPSRSSAVSSNPPRIRVNHCADSSFEATSYNTRTRDWRSGTARATWPSGCRAGLSSKRAN
jgi:hypothetical protein